MKKYYGFILLSLVIILTFICPIETFAESSSTQFNHIPIEGIIGKGNDQHSDVVDENQSDKMEKLPQLGNEGDNSNFLSFIGVVLMLIALELRFLLGGAYEKK